MNIQIYCGKKNFDAQKAERYFKERRIAFQSLDLKKHRLGEREIRLMLDTVGMMSSSLREHRQEFLTVQISRAEEILPGSSMIRAENPIAVGVWRKGAGK